MLLLSWVLSDVLFFRFQSWPRVYSPFKFIGLWQACFAGKLFAFDVILLSFITAWKTTSNKLQRNCPLTMVLTRLSVQAWFWRWTLSKELTMVAGGSWRQNSTTSKNGSCHVSHSLVWVQQNNICSKSVFPSRLEICCKCWVAQETNPRHVQTRKNCFLFLLLFLSLIVPNLKCRYFTFESFCRVVYTDPSTRDSLLGYARREPHSAIGHHGSNQFHEPHGHWQETGPHQTCTDNSRTHNYRR